MWRRALLSLLLTLVVSPLCAQQEGQQKGQQKEQQKEQQEGLQEEQQEEQYIINGDTITYRYTPIDQTFTTATEPRGRFGRWLDNYLNGGSKDVGDGVGFSLIGGPAYSSEPSLRFTIIGSMDYRTRHIPLDLQPSNLSLAASVSITGFYRIELWGHNFLGSGRHRLFYRIDVSSQPTKIWGLDYASSLDNHYGRYSAKRGLAQLRYNYAVARNTYIGLYGDYRYVAARKIDDYAATILDGHPTTASTTGFGVNLTYDSRDVTTEPHRGIYATAEFVARPKVLNNLGANLWQITATFNAFQPLWRGAILAFDLYGEFHSEDTPWMLRAELGNEWRMRGYYAGRFNGNNMITTQLELRQQIWNRLGCVAWGGGGVLFSRDEKLAWKRVLPNYGVGLRWEFSKRSNLRIDFGFGRDTFGIVVGVNEAF